MEADFIIQCYFVITFLNGFNRGPGSATLHTSQIIATGLYSGFVGIVCTLDNQSTAAKAVARLLNTEGIVIAIGIIINPLILVIQPIDVLI